MNIAVPAPQIVENKIICLNPVGYPPKVAKKSMAPRLESLDGKTVYLVDSRFDDSIELLKEVANWFASHMPGVTVKLVSLAGYYGRDDQELWSEIKANGHAAIIGVGHCSTCAPAVSTHAITMETNSAFRPWRSIPACSTRSFVPSPEWAACRIRRASSSRNR